jgi:trimethylamine--corrinoid protein Co-methyltransferase
MREEDLAIRPKLSFLGTDDIERIIAEALVLLEEFGVMVENEPARKILLESGCKQLESGGRVSIGRGLVEECTKTVPPSFELYDRNGEKTADYAGDNINFDPGSAALTLWEKDEIRSAKTQDLINLARLTESLDGYNAQSTGLIPSDVEEKLADRYRLFIALCHSRKPVITGTFSKDGFEVMKEMLIAVRGSEEELASKPLAVFDCCPSPVLSWSDLTCQALIDCARSKIPAQLVSMPLSGATSPATISGSIVQHTAENLSGIVIHQLFSPGAPIVYGGSPSFFDMRTGTTPMGAVETMMIDCGYAEVGKHLKVPTHAYMGLSDSKLPDYQAGFETALGALMAALNGINMISGPGMLNFESTQCFEKLVLDNEVCLMAKRVIGGIEGGEAAEVASLYQEFAEKGSFLSLAHTLNWFRKEGYYPGEAVDRLTLGEWQKRGSMDSISRARKRVKAILAGPHESRIDEETEARLKRIISDEASRLGSGELPGLDD